jgi:hypothetical protein
VGLQECDLRTQDVGDGCHGAELKIPSHYL